MVLLAVLLAVDPCAVEPAARDAAAAERYLGVADEELAAGSFDTAKLAYREALRHDPDSPRARQGWAALCAEPSGDAARDPFARALKLLDAGDRRGAIAAFQAVRQQEPSSAAALLQGICHYDLGEDEAAKPLLEEAEADAKLADTARLYLGFVALRGDEPRSAVTYFEWAARASDPRIGVAARDLLRALGPEGRVLLSTYASWAADSNALLAPEPASIAGGPHDGSGGAGATVLVRPLGVSGPFARLGLDYRKQFRFDAFDLGAFNAGAGWWLGGTRRHVVLEYGHAVTVLGGSRYSNVNRLQVVTSWARRGISASARYALNRERYHPEYVQSFSGARHEGDLGVGMARGNAAVEVGYRGAMASAREEPLDYREHGPRAAVTWSATRRLRVGGNVSFALRDYAVMDPTLALQRSDQRLDGALLGEWLVGRGVRLRATAGVRRTVSNYAPLTSTSFVGSFGLAHTVAWL
jgi:tetratricopeptide (TPR) repeat protein